MPYSYTRSTKLLNTERLKCTCKNLAMKKLESPLLQLLYALIDQKAIVAVKGGDVGEKASFVFASTGIDEEKVFRFSLVFFFA